MTEWSQGITGMLTKPQQVRIRADRPRTTRGHPAGRRSDFGCKGRMIDKMGRWEMRRARYEVEKTASRRGDFG